MSHRKRRRRSPVISQTEPLGEDRENRPDVSAGGEKLVIMNLDCNRAQSLISVEAEPAMKRSMSGLWDSDDLVSRRLEVEAGRWIGC